jgi:hypothetical protein
MSAYALKQPHPDGSEWIQEFDSREEAVRYQSHNGGVLVMRAQLPGQPGLWWVEVIDGEVAPGNLRKAQLSVVTRPPTPPTSTTP